MIKCVFKAAFYFHQGCIYWIKTQQKHWNVVIFFITIENIIMIIYNLN